MDKLKELLASKRKATEDEFAGKKYAKRSEIEDIRTRKLKEEEERERQEKEQRQRERDAQEAARGGTRGGVSADAAANEASREEGTAKRAPTPIPELPQLSKEEVIRRLRVLRQPVTLFGETDDQRRHRLALAERNVLLEDEAAGGQQANIRLELERENRERARLRSLQERRKSPAAARGGAGGTDVAADGSALGTTTSNTVAGGGDGTTTITTITTGDAEVDDDQRRLMASFQAAADSLAEKSLPVEDRVSKWVKRWMQEWETEIESRSEEERSSQIGRQTEIRFRETQQYFRPLYSRLKNRSLDPQLLAGIKLIIDFMKERNYLQAYKIYMGVAIGNAPWPIGVTHVGLHERSAREKISFKYSTGSAHIMNDEATRKFIQALKRLMTFVQRRYPTDPSRSVDFDGGAEGGSNRTALLEAVRRGEDVAPAPAPAHVDPRGAVKVPEKWNAMIKDALKEVTDQ